MKSAYYCNRSHLTPYFLHFFVTSSPSWMKQKTSALALVRLLIKIEQRILRLEMEIEYQSTEGAHAPIIQALQALRGVALITATSLAAEIGSFKRFPTAKKFMAYVGLIPSEYSSGERRYQGRITKTGNRHVRRLLIESAWSYRYQPAIKGQLKKRLDGLPPTIQSISWKAQNRLHKRYYRLLSRGKEGGKAITAVARELAGFIWAIAQESIEPSKGIRN